MCKTVQMVPTSDVSVWVKFQGLFVSQSLGAAEVCADAALVVVNTPSEGAWWGELSNPQHRKEGNCSKVSGDNRRDAVDE